MAIGLVGRKAGMTRIFTEDGRSIPVTVVSIPPNRVTQVKLADDHGYNAVQVTVATGERKSSKIPKSQAGHFVKAGVGAGKGLWEFRLSSEDEIPELGAEIGLDVFSDDNSREKQFLVFILSSHDVIELSADGSVHDSPQSRR